MDRKAARENAERFADLKQELTELIKELREICENSSRVFEDELEDCIEDSKS